MISNSGYVAYLENMKTQCIGYLDYALANGRTRAYFWTRLPKILWTCGRLGWATYLLQAEGKESEIK